VNTKFLAIVCILESLTITERCCAENFSKAEIINHLRNGTLGDYIVGRHGKDPDVRKLVDHIADHLMNPGEAVPGHIQHKAAHTIIDIGTSPGLRTKELRAGHWLKNVLNNAKDKNYTIIENALQINGLRLYDTDMLKTHPDLYELNNKKDKFIKCTIDKNGINAFLNSSIVCILRFVDNFTRLDNNPGVQGAPYGGSVYPAGWD
jgi:hypothetical protein